MEQVRLGRSDNQALEILELFNAVTLELNDSGVFDYREAKESVNQKDLIYGTHH